MTLIWRRLSVCIAIIAAFAACSITSRSEEPSVGGAEAPNAEAQDAPKASEEDDSIEFDDNANRSENDVAENGEATLENAVEQELNAAGNSPEELLDLATELKLSASNLLDLTKVISLCNKAEQQGLDEANLEFAKQLRLSACLDRGLAVAQLFLNPDLPVDQLPRGWEGLRDAAIGDLEAALDDNSDLPVAQLAIGRLYMLAERNDDAKKAFDASIANVETDVDAKVLAYMFRALLESDPHAALPFIEQAVALGTTSEPRLFSQYSAYLQLLDRTDEALKQIDRAIELAPSEPNYKKEKAILLAKIKRVDEARALFDEATKDAGEKLDLMVEKGQFLASINDFDGALALYTDLLEKFDGPGLYFLRGALYAQQKEYAKALADANQALRRDGNLLPALRLKGIVYVQMEKYDDAIRAFEQLKRKSKDAEGKIEATTQIAFAISKQGKYKRASGILKAELEKNPDNVEILRSLADMELLFGHWSEADALYKNLLELDPKDSGVLNNYSWLLATCPDENFRDAARALEYGKQAAEATLYAMPHILSTLAAAYAENGDFESARSWSQKAVELGEKEKHEALEDLKKELASYQENKPWRETSEVLQEVEDDPAEEQKAEDAPNEEQPAQEENAEDVPQA